MAPTCCISPTPSFPRTNFPALQQAQHFYTFGSPETLPLSRSGDTAHQGCLVMVSCGCYSPVTRRILRPTYRLCNRDNCVKRRFGPAAFVRSQRPGADSHDHDSTSAGWEFTAQSSSETHVGLTTGESSSEKLRSSPATHANYCSCVGSN